ncbi:acyltransferase [Clostridium paraputrificum]|uniref:Capsule biosynthesis protein CapG n=1 Tax=Clostridium paraputrificum TaxID=29363 RepID=A0A1B8RS44_9CLOT|nr:acyltransferase [Clostridium paraputrificum]OBY11663.1 capsule biosynthesis protein CapG [Clostridium paraputrificum]
MKIMFFLKKTYYYILKRINHTVYAKKCGVNFKEGTVFFYGNTEWGSEPWLITLGENVYLTDGVKFITHDGGTLLYRHIIPDLEITKPIKIGNDVYVGNDVIFLPGVTVGNNVVIGAGAIVTKDIPDNSLVVGVPARRIKSADDYFEKLKNESIHLGHLKGKEKEIALKNYFGYKSK